VNPNANFSAWRLILILVAIVAATVALAVAFGGSPSRQAEQAQPIRGTAVAAPERTPSTTYSDVVRAMRQGRIADATVDGGTGRSEIVFKDGSSATAVLPVQDGSLLRELAESGAEVTVKGSQGGTDRTAASVLSALLPPLVVIGLLAAWLFFMRRRARTGGSAGGFGLPDMSLRRSAELSTVPTERFGEVAGCDEAVEELAEIVEFYRDPKRFTYLGARLPSGIMLHGDPGTGKTLLAKALAGEAGLPFYATSGSDFVEKFVGVGASRVRELFDKARKHEEGAVIFIDEIDAVGRARGSGDANSEREQTLNQILVELDGFSTSDRVICIAATNRLDVLDPALLRPGRFGRHIAVPLPSAFGRAEILRVHSAGRPLAADVDLQELAATTGGLSGAQLAEVVNEAAVMAARAGAWEIARAHFREGYLRVLAGPKRRSAPIAEGELAVIATHEAGHVLCAEYGEHYEKAQQVTVEPRGQAMGLAVYGQTDRALHDPAYLHEALVATLGGRAAERIVFSRISSGAANDLQKATELARRAVEELGFSERLGQIVAGRAPFSETTRTVVDSEIERMVADAYADALSLLSAHRAELDRLSAQLLEHRVLERVDILTAIGSAAGERPPAKPLLRPAPPLGGKGFPLAATEGP
jgi:cell division protease FtsH